MKEIEITEKIEQYEKLIAARELERIDHVRILAELQDQLKIIKVASISEGGTQSDLKMMKEADSDMKMEDGEKNVSMEEMGLSDLALTKEALKESEELIRVLWMVIGTLAVMLAASLLYDPSLPDNVINISLVLFLGLLIPSQLGAHACRKREKQWLMKNESKIMNAGVKISLSQTLKKQLKKTMMPKT